MGRGFLAVALREGAVNPSLGATFPIHGKRPSLQATPSALVS